MSIATLVIVFMLLSFFDWARYQTARLILYKGAEDALAVAKLDEGMAVDTRNLDLSKPTDQEEYQKYESAVSDVVQTALSLPKKTFIHGSNENGMIKLKAVALPTGSVVDVTVLRPGERAELDGQGSGVWREHPTLCSTSTPEETTCEARISSNDSMRDILLNHPLVVEMRADVQPLSPWLPVMKIDVSAKGFKEQAQLGLYPKKPGQEFTTTSTTTSTSSTLISCAAAGPDYYPCDSIQIGEKIQIGLDRFCTYQSEDSAYPGCCQCLVDDEPIVDQPRTTTTLP